LLRLFYLSGCSHAYLSAVALLIVAVVVALSFHLGGTVTGTDGTGLILQDNGGDTFHIGNVFNIQTAIVATAYLFRFLCPRHATSTCTWLLASGTRQPFTTVVIVTSPQHPGHG